MHLILIALAALLGFGAPSPSLMARHGAGAAASAQHTTASTPVTAPLPPPASMDGVAGGGPS